MEHTAQHPEAGLASGITSVIKNAFALAFNRLELASLEFAEARNNFLKLIMMAAIGVVGGLFALAYWSVLVVYLAWDSLGWKILLLVAIAFTAVTIGVVMYVKAMLKEGKLSLPATMAELRNDREALF